jgi:acyl-CoA synthetase (AMP-forming)/AMP-acid ligase II
MTHSLPFDSFESALQSHAAERPDGLFAVIGRHRITWSELERRTRRVSCELSERMPSRYRRVALKIDDALAFFEIFFALVRARATVIPLPASFNRDSLQNILVDVVPDVLVHDDDGGGWRSLGGVATTIAAAVLRDCADRREGDAAPPAALDDADEMTILYSSGTTGTPKGVVHTSRARCHAAAKFMNTFDVGTHSRTLVNAPLYSSRTLAPVLATAFAGGTAIVLEDYSPEALLALVAEEKPSTVDLVPTQFVHLLEHPEFDPRLFDCCKYLHCGGAMLDHALSAELFRLFPASFVVGYGSTETELITLLGPRAPASKRGSVGMPVQDVELRIVDEHDEPVPRGETGEIVVRSPANMSKHLGRDIPANGGPWFDANRCSFYRTGDLGRLDADGYLWLSGRKKDMIIVAGSNVYPVDIESVLSEHPAVKQAAVVGKLHQVLGEVPVAYVVLAAEADHRNAIRSEICRWANSRLTSSQRVLEVHVVDRLPSNENGKVLKEALHTRANLPAPTPLSAYSDPP